MFISKKKLMELREIIDCLSDALAKEVKKNDDLKEKIQKLREDLKKKNSLQDTGTGTEMEAKKIGCVFNSTEECKECNRQYDGYRIDFSGNTKVDDELSKAAIAAVKAAIETLEPNNRRYDVLEYIFENLI